MEPALNQKDFVNLDEFKIEEEKEETPVYETSPIDSEIDNELQEEIIEKEEPKSIVNEEPVIEEPLFKEIKNETFEPNVEPISLEPQVTDDIIDTTFKPDEKILQAADQNLEDTKVFPPRSSVIPSEERYKVVNVEELPIKEKEIQEPPAPSVLSENLDSEILPQNLEPSVLSEIPVSSIMSESPNSSVLSETFEPSVIPSPVESLEEPVPVLETVPESLTSEPNAENNNNNDYISFNDILNGDGYNGN